MIRWRRRRAGVYVSHDGTLRIERGSPAEWVLVRTGLAHPLGFESWLSTEPSFRAAKLYAEGLVSSDD